MCKKMQKRLRRIQSNTNLITYSTLKANVDMTRTKEHQHTVMTKIVHIWTGKEGKNYSSFQKMNNNRNCWSERRTGLSRKCRYHHSWLLLPLVFSIVIEARLNAEKVNILSLSTTTTSSIDYQRSNNINSSTNLLPSEILSNATNATIPTNDWLRNDSLAHQTAYQTVNAFNKAKSRLGGGGDGSDSIFARFAKRFASGNELWDGIVRECYTKPSFTCFQKNVYVYLSDVLDAKDMNVTQALKFYHNTNNYQKKTASKQGGEKEQLYSTEASAAKDYSDSNADGDSNTLDNEIFANARRNHFSADETTEGAEIAETAETPIEEVTNALYEKSIKFAITHDVELKLPEILFDGATFRISPRSLEGNGMVAKLELIPRQQIEARLAGKILMKKIQKLFQSKLLLSFLALILIIKIIKIKIFWLLPFIIGVTAAKKLLLKFLLFLFPALSHLFKLCSYYQQTYHSTKYHHHHHLINHHHTIVPAWHSAEHVPEIIYTSPPKGHVSTYLHGAPPPAHESYKPNSHDHYDGSWELSGPGLGSDGYGHKHKNNVPAQSALNSVYAAPAHLQGSHKPQLQNTPLSAAAQIIAQYDPNRNQQQQHLQNSIQTKTVLTPEIAAQLKEALRIQTEQRLIQQQQKILDKQPFAQDGQPLMPLNYDQFYSPILLKIDKVIEQLGVTDDLCKERLVCSMYKDPARYSPHSNFVSAELSRDTSELAPVKNTNAAVIRFFRLIQAARDGQDQKDCLRLYPNCNINTE
ncbi:DUF1676 domain-containing protein Osi17 isoform 2-T12 [Glossina fuscipes fuscipes]